MSDHPPSGGDDGGGAASATSTGFAVGRGVTDPAAVVILRATREESSGAGLRVAGLPVVERAIKQLGRVPGLRVVVVTDGSVSLPRKLPSNVELRPTTDPDAAVAELRQQLNPVTPVVVGADVVRRQGQPLAGGVRVTNETERLHAEDAVFADLLRGDLGFIARHLNKKISFRITRAWLCRLPVTPNQVTLGAAAIGFLGCLLVATGSYAAMAAGFVLAQLQSILDGCDGELARVRFQQSAIGEWLDTLVDDFLNFALVGALGIGLHRAGHGWLTTTAAFVSCAMLLVYNAVSYRELVRQGVGGELLKIKWKLAPRGIDLKSLMAEKTGDAGGAKVNPATRAFLTLGRRDVFVFSWMVLAILDLLPVAALWAFVIALSCFVTAVGQLVIRDLPPGTTNGLPKR